MLMPPNCKTMWLGYSSMNSVDPWWMGSGQSNNIYFIKEIKNIYNGAPGPTKTNKLQGLEKRLRPGKHQFRAKQEGNDQRVLLNQTLTGCLIIILIFLLENREKWKWKWEWGVTKVKIISIKFLIFVFTFITHPSHPPLSISSLLSFLLQLPFFFFYTLS